ncbi:F-box domain containing protein [Trema orientale]|uniref:F-box domain containing protein n=1 Tax=Trema orientale TaxID=63057 RepID=A0A2P5D702_TREOI|nr:F-box domain containing protein [Trema orientale]
MEIASSFSSALSSSSQPFFVAVFFTALCFVLAALFTVRSLPRRRHLQSDGGEDRLKRKKLCNCACCCSTGSNGTLGGSESETAPYLNGGCGGSGGTEMLENGGAVLIERQTGASMMEQLVPEITTHALSYLDYPSLCRLSMTNSLMRKAANDDNAWKALYHKDFTLEQDSIMPVNGWKAYYAATRAIVNMNSEFFNIIRERSLPAMRRFWLNADYVKCVHASGELFSGYNPVIQSWQFAFNWDQGVNFQIRDVRARVLTEMAWVTMKTYVDMDTGPFNVTNVFEFHNGRWYMVHHHSSVMEVELEQQILHG